MYYAKAGTKECFESEEMPKNVTSLAVMGKSGEILEDEALGCCLYIEMSSLQPTPDHYAIDGEWLLSSEFM